MKKLLGVSLALVMVLGTIPLGFSEPLRVQLEQGLEINQIQCDNPNHVLVLRTHGNLACVYERTADALGWEEIKTVVEILDEKEDTQSSAPLVQLNMASPVPFVDDGREIQRSMLQKAPAPVPMYDKIMGKTTADDFAVSSDGVARFAAISHEKYSLNEGVGYYPEDWMPTYIPDGQKLLYTSTTYYEKTSNYVLGITFVPTSFVLHANTTNYDLQVSKGFTIGVEYWSSGADETEDNIELLKETRESQPGNYGGFTEMTRDGKTVMAYEGGNLLNHYSAGFSFNPDKFTSMHVTSNYHTLDELLPIFESIMK